jgi:uncharacterized RDD family membrane protein YckC
MSDARVPYAGIATRAIALAVDIAIAQVIVFAGGAVLALVGSLVSDVRLDTLLERFLAAFAWAAVVGSYFVVFWSTAGQTPAMRLIGLRVMDATGGHPSVPRSLVRLVGLGLAIIPLGAGFLPVLVDDRRRALQDLMAGTVVVYAEEKPPAPGEAPAHVAATSPPPSSGTELRTG